MHLAAGVNGRRGEQRQLERVTVQARYFGRHLGIDYEIFIAGVKLYSGYILRRYRHAAFQRSEFKRRVDSNVAARLGQYAFLDELAEAGHLYRD